MSNLQVLSVTSLLQGSLKGSLKGPLKGSLEGPLKGSLQGSLKGPLKGSLKGPLKGPRNGSRRAIFSPIGPMFLLSHSYQPLSSPEMKRCPDVKEGYCRDAATNPICFERGVTTGNIVRYRAHKQGAETKPYQAAE